MFIVFACPGMPFRGDTIESGKSLGGSETACYYVAREMAARGHRVTVFTTDPHANGKWDGVDYAFCGAQSPQYPVGDLLQSFMESAECDALVVQRAAGIMRMPHCAKTAFWWLHDLALVRSLPAVRQDSFHYDGVFAVSEWHKRQVHDVWDFPLDFIRVLPNAVDRTLYEGLQEPHLPAELALIYQSRYERGIDYLIRPGGIMDQLATKRPRAKLYVCGYQNEPEHMRGYYEQVRNRIRSMPNAELLGYLSKRDLARLQSAADLLVYPGEFEETSCITAMEAQCAGLPFVASECGALPETCEGAGAKLIPLKDGRCDEEAFVKYLCGVNEDTLKHMREQQRAKAETISWSKSADVLEQAIAETLAAKQRNRFSMLRSMLDRSDIMFAREYVKRSANGAGQSPEARELAEQYAFAEDLAAHYDSDAALAALEADQSLDVTENTRFRFVREELTRAGDVTNVLDYGCQKGHFLFSLAKTLGPGVRYTGIEISKRTVEWAQKRFAELGLAGEVTFKQGDALAEDFDYGRYGKFDALILGEVLEHVPDPVKLCSRLEPLLVDGARVVITTPYGEWEGKEYHDRPDQARFHLHHFELSDLHDMFAHHDGFVVIGAAAGRSAHGTLGSYIVSFTWRAGQPLAKPVDYERKLREYTPRQTLSFCALAKDSERTILRSLMSVKDVADEFVIALDKTSSDGTRAILERFRDQFCRFRRFVILDAESPLEIGFDEARNRTLREARGDWIMWMDTDE
ncbi:MAG TPA: methyltransferase domain-containing protein, partial [Steroidobacteraceae bacterium]